MIAVDHRQGFAAGREVDDILAAEIFAQNDGCWELKHSVIAAVLAAGPVREMDPLRPEPDDDVIWSRVGRNVRRKRKEGGRAPSGISAPLQGSAQEIGWGKPDQGHGA